MTCKWNPEASLCETHWCWVCDESHCQDREDES